MRLRLSAILIDGLSGVVYGDIDKTGWFPGILGGQPVFSVNPKNEPPKCKGMLEYYL